MITDAELKILNNALKYCDEDEQYDIVIDTDILRRLVEYVDKTSIDVQATVNNACGKALYEENIRLDAEAMAALIDSEIDDHCCMFNMDNEGVCMICGHQIELPEATD